MSNGRALLVIDVQRVYMEPEPMVTAAGDDLVPKCRALIARARETGVPVLYVQHVSEDQPDDPVLVGIHPEIAPRSGEPVIRKEFGSAFVKTSLQQHLQELRVQTLYICGLATFGCVHATVMCALCKEYVVNVVEDAHGTTDLPGSTAAEIVVHFNRTWKRAGASLQRAADVTF